MAAYALSGTNHARCMPDKRSAIGQ